MIKLDGKVIAVTGGASGIGRATVKLLASLGAKVSIGDIQQKGLEAVAKEIKDAGHGDVFTMVIDVRNRESVDLWIKETIKWGGKLDGAANLAGVLGKSIGVVGVKDQDDEEWDFIMDVNLKGLMHCMRAQLQVMSKNASIVNASSIEGLQGFRYNAAYSASKHAVHGLSRSAAKECGADGIRVNCVAPGAIKTPMLTQGLKVIGDVGLIETPISRFGEAEEVANLIAFLLSDASSFITGAVYSIDGGWAC